uniref:Uncharacterized protein n=1 Tax=Pantoea phage Survivor TaxID=3232176 RepID=A0AAU8KYY5_9CAUD
MKIGKMLKEEHGFDLASQFMFAERYGYNKYLIDGIMADKWSCLLKCHIDDLVEFTGIPAEKFAEWSEGDGQTREYCAPLGRPYPDNPPVMANIDIPAFEQAKLFANKTAFGTTLRAGITPLPGETEFKPSEGDLVPEIPPIMDYPCSLVRRNEDVPEANEEQLQALFNRVRNYHKDHPLVIHHELQIKDIEELFPHLKRKPEPEIRLTTSQIKARCSDLDLEEIYLQHFKNRALGLYNEGVQTDPEVLDVQLSSTNRDVTMKEINYHVLEAVAKYFNENEQFQSELTLFGMTIAHRINFVAKHDAPIEKPEAEVCTVPIDLLQCLYDIACEHNYPIAADACEILQQARKEKE